MKIVKGVLAVALGAAAIGAFAWQSQTGNLERDAAKLVRDLDADLQHSTVTPEQRTALEDAVFSIVRSAHRPDAKTVAAFRSVLKAHRGDLKTNPQSRQAVLGAAGKVALNAGVPPDQLMALRKAGWSIYKSSPVSRAQMRQLGQDAMAILRDLPEGSK